MYQVLKRDGGTVEFEISKIGAAMVKAFDAVERSKMGFFASLFFGATKYLEQMRQKMEKSLQDYTDERGEMDLQDRLLRQAAATLDYTVNPDELEAAVEEQIKAMEAQLAQQGLNLEMYCAFMKTTPEDLRKDAYPAAEAALRNFAAVDKIVELEKLEASQEEIGQALALIGRQNGLTMEQMKEYYTPEFEKAVLRSVMTTKVMQLIRDSAVVTDI